MRLCVAALRLELHLEAAALVLRVVRLAERIGDFDAADVELEALDRVRVVGITLGERRDSVGKS